MAGWTRPLGVVRILCAVILMYTAATADEVATEPPSQRSRIRVHAGWPEGITYEVRQKTPEFSHLGPLTYFEEVFLLGRIGIRLDVDAAAFAADAGLSDFDNDVSVRRARFYLLGDFQLGIPLAYKFEVSIEGSNVYLNDFYLRWKPSRWVDSVDFGYLTPPWDWRTWSAADPSPSWKSARRCRRWRPVFVPASPLPVTGNPG